MGIKYLWNIFDPFCEKKPLFELQHKTLAVDLSCWICEAQNIAEYQIQPKMYLRNLYFRTCCLLLLECRPVFVLEGKAPEMKYDTISARNAVQFKGARPKSDKVKTGKDRTRFHFTLKCCEEMLGYMGLACLRGEGEAEALCAYLNHTGLVDGCISQDSDCFAYGAQVVYRNFSISSQGHHAATGGSIDVYNINKIFEEIDFGRNKVVALALLAGSDYCEGVHGIGKESVLKLFEKVKDSQIIEHLKSWKTNTNYYNKIESKLNDRNICNSCGHRGKLQMHTKNGCIPCGISKGCKQDLKDLKVEIAMRQKALQDPLFPDQTLIDEFLLQKEKVDKINVKWKRPDLIRFIAFCSKHLQWEEIYAFEKIFPILTRWQLLHPNQQSDFLLQPKRIIKIRNPKGIPSFELEWAPISNYFEQLHLNELPEEDQENLFHTIEPQHLIQELYPELVEAFHESKKKPVKRKVTKKAITDLGDLLQNTSISEPVPKKKATKKQTNTLDKFVKQKSNLDDITNLTTNKDSLLKKVLKNTISSSTPKKANCSFNLDMSGFGDEEEPFDSSNLIDKITKSPPEYLKNLSQSQSFLNIAENDLFEQTFNEFVCLSDESTEEYKMPCEEFNDSFDIIKAPLLDRFKNK